MTKNPKSGQPLNPAHEDSSSVSLHIGFIFMLVIPWGLHFQTLSRQRQQGKERGAVSSDMSSLNWKVSLEASSSPILLSHCPDTDHIQSGCPPTAHLYANWRKAALPQTPWCGLGGTQLLALGSDWSMLALLKVFSVEGAGMNLWSRTALFSKAAIIATQGFLNLI